MSALSPVWKRVTGDALVKDIEALLRLCDLDELREVERRLAVIIAEESKE